MPKGRRTTILRSGGGAGGGGGAAVAAAAAGAPPAARRPAPLRAEVWSEARRRMETLLVEPLGPGEALVRSGSGNDYRVRYEGEGAPRCTCPDWQFRGSRGRIAACRHMLAVRSALGGAAPRGEAEALRPEVPVRERARFDAARAAAEAEEARAASRAAADATAARAAGEHEVLLGEDSAFAELFARASQGDVPYEYENVLDDPDARFGVEIEFSGGDVEAIAAELHRRGLIPRPRMEPYHGPRRAGMWSLERDGSVTGGEVVSPVLSDNPESWRQIEEVCEVIRRHGGVADRACGAHVHIALGPLDRDRIRWSSLLTLCRRYEDFLYRAAAGGESGGEHRGTRYAVPLGTAGPGAEHSHYSAVNFRNETVEFRHFNGTLDPRQIQANVRLAHALVRAASRTAAAGEEEGWPDPAPWGSMADPARRRAEERAHGTARGLLDRLFTRARDKLSVLWLYATSRWQARTA